jgi:uroporphyrinogen decarboxylase
MTAREKFHAVMSFEKDARNLKAEFGYWAGAVRRWLKEGLPMLEGIPESAADGDLVRGEAPVWEGAGGLTDRNVMPRLGLDSYLAKFPLDLSPMLAAEAIEETAEHRVFRDVFGITKKVMKTSASTPFVIDYPIKTRRDFEAYRELYDRDFKKRLPNDWARIAAELRRRTFPVRLGGNPFGFSFFARHLMGDVGFMTGMYDDPALIKEFNEFFLGFTLEYWSLILADIEVDCVFILEDICYRSGSMVSPAMFEEFMAPYTRRVAGFARDHGIENVFVDSDGLVTELIPLWVKCGVNGLFPVEALNDMAAIRERYPKLRFLGGVDKRPLITGGKDEIDRELARIERVMSAGGYIPHIDHAVPADISWKNFAYYRSRLNGIIDGDV